LQAAIDYSTSTGVYKPVKIPNGTFNTKPVSATAGTHIVGSGNSILQAVAGSTYPHPAGIGETGTIYVNGDNTIIENLEIVGLYNNNFEQSNIYVYDCNDVTIRNCRVQSASGNGIVLTNTQRCKVSDNLVYRSGGNGIVIHSFNEAPVDSTSGSMRNIVNNNICYSSGVRDLGEWSHAGSDNPNYNIITSNICDTSNKLYFTGTNSITGLNVVSDLTTTGVTDTRGLSSFTDGGETYTIINGRITSIA
jgi:parallel beta-helix repeat protein